MAVSNAQKQGFLLIDNRLAPPEPGIPRFFEGATKTCPHCTGQVVLNPARTRERGHCRRCDSYLCDGCAVLAKLSGGECRPFSAVVEDIGRRTNNLRMI